MIRHYTGTNYELILNPVIFRSGQDAITVRRLKSQNGVNAVQQYSVENHEGRYRHRLCAAIAPFWFSTEHL